MDEEVEARIRRRAQELWELDGRPLDKSLSYWLAAEREIIGIAPDVHDAADTQQSGTAIDAAGDAPAQASIVSAFAPGTTPSDPRHD